MALPDYLKFGQGTAIVFGDSGGSGVTNTMTLGGITTANGRMGPVVDLGVLWDQDYEVHLWIATNSAPTAGLTAELYIAGSYDNTNFPGKVTGSDAAYPATVAANKLQLGPPVATLVATADATTTLKQNPVIWTPPARYIVPVVINLTGQTLAAATSGSRVILVPLKTSVED